MVLPPKKPSWSNRFVTLLEQQGDNVDTPPLSEQFTFPDKDTRVDLVWNVSQSEFTQVFSALMYGADFAYPSLAIETVEIFLRCVHNMNICDLVADCISTSASVQSALSVYNQVNNSGGAAGGNGGNELWAQALPASVMESNVIPQGALCTEANKYAMSNAIVNALDKLTQDFLQIVEVITNPNEIAAEMIQGVPIFGGGASLTLDTAAWLQDNIKEVYDAAYNPTTELDYTCAIYCKFDACNLSYKNIMDAYSEQGSIAPPQDTDFFTVMSWIITNVLPATDNLIVGAMHYFILLCLEYGSNWFGSGVWTYIQIQIENAKDEEITVPQSCLCGGWCVLFDFTVSNQSFEVNPGAPYGQYLASQGWGCTYDNAGGFNDNRSIIRRVFTQSFTPDNYEVSYRATNLGVGNNTNLVGSLNGNIVFIHSLGAGNPDGNEYTRLYNGIHTIDEISLQAVTGTGSSGLDPDAYIHTKLKMSASGGIPPIASNC